MSFLDDIGDFGQDILDTAGDATKQLDDVVHDNVPGGWATVAAMAMGMPGGFEMGGLGSMFGGAEGLAGLGELGGMDMAMADLAGSAGLGEIAGASAAPSLGGFDAAMADLAGNAPAFGQASNISSGLNLGTATGGDLSAAYDMGAIGAPGAGGYTAPGGFSLSDVGSWMKQNPMKTAKLGAGLFDMYNANKAGNAQMGRYNDIQNQINNMYAPGSPEERALAKSIARKDAASGRASQYGARAVDLAGQIAKIKQDSLIRSLSAQNALQAGALGTKGGGLSSLFRVLPSVLGG